MSVRFDEDHQRARSVTALASSPHGSTSGAGSASTPSTLAIASANTVTARSGLSP